jgi:hypothetical protein
MSGPNSKTAWGVIVGKRRIVLQTVVNRRIPDYDGFNGPVMAADPCYVDADVALAIGSVVGVPRIGPDAYCGLAFGGAMIQRLGPQTPFRSPHVRFLSGPLDICDSPLNHLDLRSLPFLSGADPIWGCWTMRCSAEPRTERSQPICDDRQPKHSAS